MILSKWGPKATNIFLSQNLILWWLISWYRKYISNLISWAKLWTTIFAPLNQHIIGIRILGNSVGHIQTTITLWIFIKEIRNLCSNSSSKCLLSKTFSPGLRIPYRSKVIIETVTEDHFPTQFPKRLTLVNIWPLTYFFFHPLVFIWLISQYRKNISKPISSTKR